MKATLEGARKLARNPLGIIALFVALVYGFATLLLGLSNQHLTSAERLPLVWFVVLFPGLVLIVFYRLVTHHHGKLYSPRDYPGDGFLQTLHPSEQAARVEAEIEAVQQQPSPPPNEAIHIGGSGPPLATAPARPQGGDSDLLRLRLLEAERLGVVKAEAGLGTALRHQVAFGEGHAIAFDGVATTDKEIVAVEVKYLREPWVSNRTVQDFVQRGLAAEAFLRRQSDDRQVRVLVIFVVGKDTGGGLTRLHNVMDAHIKGVPIKIEYQSYFFDDLKRELDLPPR